MMNIDEYASELKKIDKPIRIIAEQSVDGVLAGFLLSKLLGKLEKKFIVSFCDKNGVKSSLREDYEYFILIFNEKIEIDSSEKNVFSFSLKESFDGTEFEYLSEMIYSFFGRFDFNDYGKFLIVNYCGNKISDFGSKILKECVENKKLIPVNCMNMFYNVTRPLVKTIAYSFDPCLKSVYGEESKARSFLDKIKIDYDKMIIELDGEESERLITGCVLDMVGVEEGTPFGCYYVTDDKQDLFWLHFMIRTCLNYGKPGAAFGFLNKSKKDVAIVNELIDRHSLEMIKAVKFVFENKVENDCYMIFNLGGEFKEEIIEDLVKLLVKRRVVNSGILMITNYSLTNEFVVYGKIPKGMINLFLEEMNCFGVYRFDADGYYLGKIKDEEGFMKKAEFLFKNHALEEGIVQ